MEDLPLNALRAFAAVHAQRGVRAAARELGIAHSSVSRHLAELQAWLGVTLMEETSGRQAPRFTSQGEVLGRAVLAGLAEIAQAVAEVREAKSPNAVSLSTTPSFAARWLLPRLPGFERAHPGVELSVLVDQKLDPPGARGIDLAVRMGRGPWPELDCTPLMDETLYPVMGRAYWEDAGRPTRVDALRRLRLLHDRDPQAGWERWRAAHGPGGLDVRKGPRYSSSDLVLRAAAQGQGVALARDRLVRDDLASGALVRPVPALAVTLPDAYWIVLPRGPRVRSATAAVVSWLRREAALG